MKMKLETQVIILSAVVGIILFIFNIIFIFSVYLSFVSIAIVIIGPSIIQYIKYHEQREIEERFPDFLRDVSGNIKAGMTLPQAIKATKETDYGALTRHVKRIIMQVDWGVPFDKILKKFSKDSTSFIKRTVSTIIETHKGGGNIAEIFDNIGKSSYEVNKINKERISTIYTQMVTGYVIFFVFIGVLIALQKFLIPSLSVISSPELGFIDVSVLSAIYTDIFQWLILIQGFFSGLVIGKMAEGSMIAGLKHCLALMFIGFTIFVFLV
ncbi:MAG: type II secretion system F family protein [Candidatus Aenigmatarchaeota archaeon]